MKQWAEILLRSAAMFIIALVILRVLGKKQASRTTPFSYLTYMVIAVIAALTSVKLIAGFTFGLIGLGVWTLLSITLDYLAIKSKWIHDVLNGKETILVKQGKVMEENLLQVRMNGEELLSELRSKNVFNLGDVEFAVMETTGDINVLLKSDKKMLTAHDLEQKMAPITEPQTVILDGNIMEESLTSLGLNHEWLQVQLDSMEVSTKNVFIGQVDSSGDLYLDLYDDAVRLARPKVKELIYANLERVQADLSTYALETKNEGAREMYQKNAEKIRCILDRLRLYLLH
jgi:uncharacterized membrane protein YcaP (DUF421 family)